MIRWARRRDLRDRSDCSKFAYSRTKVGTPDTGAIWREEWLAALASSQSPPKVCRHIEGCDRSYDLRAVLRGIGQTAAPGSLIALATDFNVHWLCDWRGVIRELGWQSNGIGANDPLPGDPRVTAKWLNTGELLTIGPPDAYTFSIGLTLRIPYTLANIGKRRFNIASCTPYQRELTCVANSFPVPLSLRNAAGFSLQDVAHAYRVPAADAVQLLTELIAAGVACERS